MVRVVSSVLHEVVSQPAIERLKVGLLQTQVMFERLLQEAGGARPRGMHFCCSQGKFS